MRQTLLFLVAAIAVGATANYKVVSHWKVGGDGGWDYVCVDSEANRLYVSHATHATVLDLNTGSIVGQIADTPGIHGIAVVPKAGVGFTSNGKDDSLSVFNLKSLALRTRIKVGRNPDALQYEPTANVVISFNAGSRDATVVSVEGLAVLNTIPLNAKPEFSATDGKGNVWVNLEDRNSVARLAGAPLKVMNTWPLDGCQEPSGLALDVNNRRLFSVCANKVMTVTDADNGKQVARLPIGEGADGVAFDPVGMNAVASAGGDGVATVVHESAPDKFTVSGNVPTMKSARTIGVDPRTGRFFLPVAEILPPSPGAKRGSAKPGTFEVIVLGR